MIFILAVLTAALSCLFLAIGLPVILTANCLPNFFCFNNPQYLAGFILLIFCGVFFIGFFVILALRRFI